MYNRYIRQDDGSYTRVTEPEAPARGPGPPPPQGGAPPNTPPNKEQERPRPDGPQPSAPGGQLPFTFPPFSGGTEGIAGYLRRVLDQLRSWGTDCAGVGSQVSQADPARWEKLGPQWTRLFSAVPVEISVEVSLGER